MGYVTKFFSGKMLNYRDKDWLIKRYIVEMIPMWKIAKECGIDYHTVYYWMSKFDIKKRNYSECVKGNHINLNKECLEFIEGEMLGDGSFFPYKSISARYQHGSKYKEYLFWLESILQMYGVKTSGEIQTRNSTLSNGKTYVGYKYITLWYRNFYDLYKKWYPNGKKIVPKDLKLTPITVRQWYIGDGCLVRPKKGNPWIQLSTDAFDTSSNDYLIGKLRELGFKGNYLPKSNHRIHLSVHSTKDFLNYIGDCPKEIETIYGYKWNI